MNSTKGSIDAAEWRIQFRRHRALVVYSVLLAICAASVSPIIVYLYPRAFPWWSDGGIWLKQLNAVFGLEYPMWGERAFQFDQLYLLYLASLELLLRNNIMALETSGLLMYAARVATTFILARKLFKSEVAGMAAALLSGFHPLFFETFGWGGYPNLLGYALLPLAFYAMLISVEKASRRNLAFTALTVASVAFAHNLTSMIFLGVLGVWFVLLAVMKVSLRPANVMREVRVVAFAIVIVLSAYVIQMLVVGLPPYAYFNEAAFYRLRIGLGDLLWAVKNQTVALALILAIIASFIMIQLVRGDRARSCILAMESWILAPLLMSQAYLLGVTFDYRRAFLFAIQPGLIMAMAPLALLAEILPKGSIPLGISQKIPMTRFVRKAVRVLPAIILVLLSLSILLSQVAVGVTYVKVVDDWYNHVDLYGDKDKMDALQWIMRSSPTDAVFVAEEPFAHWIEGLTSRRALVYSSPEYLFVKGESERSLAARAVLECEVELRNDLIRVCDQYPYGNYTPSISFLMQGIYEDTFDISGLESKLYLSNGTNAWSERLDQNVTLSRTHNLSMNSRSALYETRQVYDSLSVTREIVLDGDDEQASLSYTARTNNASVRLLNFTIPLLSAEGVGFDEVRAESVNQVHVRSGPIWFHLSLGGDIRSAQFIDTNATDAIVLNYGGESGSSGSISATITISSDQQPTGSEGLVAFSWQDVVRQFNISYVVIPRVSEVSPSGMIPLKLLSLPLYNHLLQDPGLRVVYQNPKVIILQVLCCQDQG
jgi:hypothetical protein